jgi:hypothetical protein
MKLRKITAIKMNNTNYGIIKQNHDHFEDSFSLGKIFEIILNAKI